MSAFKGTPGPWEPAQHAPSGLIYGIRGWHGPESVNVVNWGGISRPASICGQANARLIAAAPELLSELEYARTTLSLLRTDVARSAKVDPRWEGMDENFAEWLGRIDSAIAKATGGKP